MKLVRIWLVFLWTGSWGWALGPNEEYLEQLNQTFCHYGNLEMEARWQYVTDITSAHETAMNEARLAFQELKKAATQNISQIDWSDTSPLAQREAKFYSSLGSNLTTEQLSQMNQLGAQMESIYSQAKICRLGQDPETCVPSLPLEPDLTELMAHSRNAQELQHAWTQWRSVSGQQYRQQYLDFIGINNQGAESLGFDNLKELWLERYESEDFPALIQQVWTEAVDVGEGRYISLEGFYKQFHAYVRAKLRDFYADQVLEVFDDFKIQTLPLYFS